MKILGLSCFYHDSSAALLDDGVIVAAAQEERFTRKKHDEGFPKNAVDYCLKTGGIGASGLDYVVFYEKPFLKFDRIFEMFLATAPNGWDMFIKAMPSWLKQKLWMEGEIKKQLGFKGPVLFSEHHQSHAASAFYASPFKKAAVLTVDGVGEWATTTMGVGDGKQITLQREIRFPHSLGLLYSAFTAYLGFKVNSGEYKVMGLAPYGKPTYHDQIMKNIVELKQDGSFKLNMDYFSFLTELQTTNQKFDDLLGGAPRKPETPFDQRHYNIARSIQSVTEEVMLSMANKLRDDTNEKYLCMAGGVALNCVANGRILRETGFEDIYVQPAAGDAGGSVGAAAIAYHQFLGNERKEMMPNAYLGPSYSDGEIEAYLESVGATYSRHEDKQLAKLAGDWIADGRIVGWFEGRMEFGPRALGSRSILADPTDPKMKDHLNERIKLREAFRPFAPAVHEDKVGEYFELDRPSPYMLLVANTREKYRKKLPSITHVDGSARIQTISREQNPLYYDVISAFHKHSGIAVIINTSFNIRGEPLVCKPSEAYACFMRTGMDDLVMGSFAMRKEEQHPDESKLEIREFGLD